MPSGNTLVLQQTSLFGLLIFHGFGLRCHFRLHLSVGASPSFELFGAVRHATIVGGHVALFSQAALRAALRGPPPPKNCQSWKMNLRNCKMNLGNWMIICLLPRAAVQRPSSLLPLSLSWARGSRPARPTRGRRCAASWSASCEPMRMHAFNMRKWEMPLMGVHRAEGMALRPCQQKHITKHHDKKS